jgi:hypothetical protein
MILLYLCFVIEFIYVYIVGTDTPFGWFVHVDVDLVAMKQMFLGDWMMSR